MPGGSQPKICGLWALFCAGAVAFTQPAHADTVIRLQSYLDAFVESPSRTAQEDSVLWWNRMSLSTDVNLTKRLAFEFAGYASFTSPSTLHGAPSAPGEDTVSARYADITAFNLRMNWKRFDLMAGKDGLNLGVGELYSPLGAFEPVNLNDPLHTFNMGLWQAGADVYMAEQSLSFRVIPFDERSRLPASGSRWLGDTGDLALIDIGNLPPAMPPLQNLTVLDRFRGDSPSNWGYLAAYKGTGEGFDVTAGAYYGPGIYPVVRVELPGSDVIVLKERADSLIGFGTFAWVSSQWKAYGELLLQHAPDGDDDDFVQVMAGLKYDSWNLAEALDAETVTLTMEYTGDHTLGTMDAKGLRFSSQFTRPYRNSLLARLDLGLTSDLSVYGKAEVNAHKWDSAIWAGLRYAYTDDLAFHLQLNLFDGEPNTPFGRWRSNDGMFFGVEYAL